MKKSLLLFLPFLLFAKGYEEPWGKDAFLFPKKTEETFQKKSLASSSAESIISFYQSFLSPTTGKRSSFRPTSSRYMQLAIKRYGFLKGFIMGCDRLLRENDEKWVYRTVEIEGATYKYDPARLEKY